MHLKAHPIKLCKTGNIRSNFQKLGTFGNLKVLPFQNHHFLLDQAIYVDFILILVKETMIFECKIPPCIFRPIWPKIKISIKVIKYRYVGFIWDPKLKILLNKLNGYNFMSQMFDIFVIFTSLDFRESAEFNKNKGW